MKSRPFVSFRVINGEGCRMTNRDFLRDHQALIFDIFIKLRPLNYMDFCNRANTLNFMMNSNWLQVSLKIQKNPFVLEVILFIIFI
jgi:hypothetical protein